MNPGISFLSILHRAVALLTIGALIGAAFLLEAPPTRQTATEHQLVEQTSHVLVALLPPSKQSSRVEQQVSFAAPLLEAHYLRHHPVLLHEVERVMGSIHPLSASLFVSLVASSYL